MGTGDWWGRSGSQEVEAGISVLGRSGPQAWPVGGRRRKQEGQREKQSFGVDLTGHLRDPWGALELKWPFRAEFAWNGQAFRPQQPSALGLPLADGSAAAVAPERAASRGSCADSTASSWGNR